MYTFLHLFNRSLQPVIALYFHVAFSYSCTTLDVLCANIIKNIEDTIIHEHKLRKRVVFSLDMVIFCKDFYLQYHKRVQHNTQFSVECHTKMLVCFLIEQARQTLGFCFPEVLFHNREFSERTYLGIMMYLCSQISKTKQTWK